MDPTSIFIGYSRDLVKGQSDSRTLLPALEFVAVVKYNGLNAHASIFSTKKN